MRHTVEITQAQGNLVRGLMQAAQNAQAQINAALSGILAGHDIIEARDVKLDGTALSYDDGQADER